MHCLGAGKAISAPGGAMYKETSYSMAFLLVMMMKVLAAAQSSVSSFTCRLCFCHLIVKGCL